MKIIDSAKNGNSNQFKKESKEYEHSATGNTERLRESQNFTSTAEIMEAMSASL